jgi:hypothetical protein
MHWHYLSRFVAELDGASSAAPGRDGAGRGSVNVGEVGRPQSGGRDEREGDAPEPAVAFAGRDQHGRPTEDATDGARIAALEQNSRSSFRSTKWLSSASHDTTVGAPNRCDLNTAPYLHGRRRTAAQSHAYMGLTLFSGFTNPAAGP